jgi:hypothetical protein
MVSPSVTFKERLIGENKVIGTGDYEAHPIGKGIKETEVVEQTNSSFIAGAFPIVSIQK